MKKLALGIAVALATVGTATAQDAPEYENWVGLFGQYYIPDKDKIEPIGGLEPGRGFGGEFGFRFDENWAVRFELGRLVLDHDNNVAGASDEDGVQLGVDAVYFLQDDVAYLFAGIRQQALDTNSFRMADVGVGRHWKLSDNWRLITELATYYDFGQGYSEFGAKLGLTYTFGDNGGSSNKDSDGDGVYDAVDRCPTTPRGTRVDATGCNIDKDGDGVFNNQDQCPNTPAGAKVDARGCAIKDGDNDGVIDANDMCPNTAPGVRVNAKGCAVDLDKDNDGVLDSRDQCLNTPITDRVDENGCSIFEQVEVSVSLDILFANNSSVIGNPNSMEIREFVEFMKRFPNTQTTIGGHSSSVGNDDYNMRLSQKRADAVRNLLINEYGIAGNRIKAVGYGETRPIDPSNTPEAHRVNRRIDAKVTAFEEVKLTK